MKKSRFTEEQIVGVIKESEAGIPVAELCRKHGISDGTFYKWRAKYGGMQVSDVKKMKGLEEENATLKRLLGQKELELTAVKAVLEKKW
jgi:putative transposase